MIVRKCVAMHTLVKCIKPRNRSSNYSFSARMIIDGTEYITNISSDTELFSGGKFRDDI